MTKELDRIKVLKLTADPVRDDEYWTSGLDIAPPNQPLVHRDLKGELNIRVQNVPTSTNENLICWVQIVEGDLFTGVGKLIVDSFTEESLNEEIVEPDDLIYYREGSQTEMPRYSGIHKKALDW
jgi:hypothetical protein|tara:strand:- start:2302 stop:2673 length:372 start_codon:yes stop_codon:yes gene_type:complete